MDVVNWGHDPHIHIGPLTCEVSHCARKGQVETPETNSSKPREQRKNKQYTRGMIEMSISHARIYRMHGHWTHISN